MSLDSTEQTAVELWRQMSGDIACFVTGVGKFLKEHRKSTKIVAVEPKNVSDLLGNEPGLHQMQPYAEG